MFSFSSIIIVDICYSHFDLFFVPFLFFLCSLLFSGRKTRVKKINLYNTYNKIIIDNLLFI